jgi:hypothetical protein
MTVLAGKSITQAGDKLNKVDIEYLYRAISKPKDELATAIRRLRMLSTLDKSSYNFHKKQLPYITCGIFNPPIRRTENFAYIQYFIVDIDHCAEKGISLGGLKERLKQDKRIVLIFASPGNDGLKIMFKLNEKCYDAQKYSYFYKIFIAAFAKQNDLTQVVDNKTSDVTRACFFSHDAFAHFNPDAETILMEKWVDFTNFNNVKKTIKEIDKENKNIDEPKLETNNNLTNDVLNEIKKKLNPNARIKKQKNIYVPEELEAVIDTIKQKAQELQLNVLEIRNINYGKKFIFGFAHKMAEINLFYGKHGFKVVKSPKNGTDPELNDIVYIMMCDLFY